MIKAAAAHRDIVVNLLVHSFDDNKSVNHIIKQDGKRAQRIRLLMEYAFDMCLLFGDVFLTADEQACALLIKPDKKRSTLRSVYLDTAFALRCLGIANIKKALQREAAIGKVHPKGLLYYLWFIGVKPGRQQQGIGSILLKAIIEQAAIQQRTICLETSAEKNIPWYLHRGFSIYQKLDFGYTLYCMKKDV